MNFSDMGLTLRPKEEGHITELILKAIKRHEEWLRKNRPSYEVQPNGHLKMILNPLPLEK